MAAPRVQSGSVLERRRSGAGTWLVVIPVVLVVVGGVAFGLRTVSRVDDVARQVAVLEGQVAEARKAVAVRDGLLAEARRDEELLRSPGQATALLHGVDAAATESGTVLAIPAAHAARIVVYGMVAPKEGEEYVAVARTEGGARKPLGQLILTGAGSAFLLAKDIPEGTRSVEVLIRPAGKEEGLDDLPARAAARWPSGAGERGVLTRPTVQARTAVQRRTGR